jgi:hypothetical protein
VVYKKDRWSESGLSWSPSKVLRRREGFQASKDDCEEEDPRSSGGGLEQR